LRSPSFLRPTFEAVGAPFHSSRPLGPYAPTALIPYCLHWCQRFVRVVRQGVPSRAQRKVHERAQQMRRDDETRWRPARHSPSSRRRPPADHSNGPPHSSGNPQALEDRPGQSSGRLNPYCPTKSSITALRIRAGGKTPCARMKSWKARALNSSPWRRSTSARSSISRE